MGAGEIVAFIVIPVVVAFLTLFVVPLVGWMMLRVVQYGQDIATLKAHHETSSTTLNKVEKNVERILKLIYKNNSILDTEETVLETLN